MPVSSLSLYATTTTTTTLVHTSISLAVNAYQVSRSKCLILSSHIPCFCQEVLSRILLVPLGYSLFNHWWNISWTLTVNPWSLQVLPWSQDIERWVTVFMLRVPRIRPCIAKSTHLYTLGEPEQRKHLQWEWHSQAEAGGKMTAQERAKMSCLL